MILPKIKVSEIAKWNPCDKSFPPLTTYADREFNALDALRTPVLDGKNNYRLWIVCRLDLLDAKTLQLFSCDCVERALKLANVKDERSWEVIKQARLFVTGGGDRKSLRKATVAYVAVANTAYATVAYAAATAIGAATADATDDDSYDAFREKERAWQVKRLIELIEKEYKLK